jgi:hypothetical protein
MLIDCSFSSPLLTGRVRSSPYVPVRPGPSTDPGSGPVRSRTPAALRSSATRNRSAGRARQGRCKPRPTDPLLAKPDRGRSLPGQVTNDAGHGRRGLVRGCALGTGRDRCEWHAGGTAGEDDRCEACQCWLQLDRWARPDPGRRLPGCRGPPDRGSRRVGRLGRSGRPVSAAIAPFSDPKLADPTSATGVAPGRSECWAAWKPWRSYSCLLPSLVASR